MAGASNSSVLSGLQCDQILSSITNTVRNVVLQLTQGNNRFQDLINRLRSCQENLDSISDRLHVTSTQEVNESIGSLVNHIEQIQLHATHNRSNHGVPPLEIQQRGAIVNYEAARIRPEKGSKGGRPKLDVTKEQLKMLLKEGYTSKDMARQLSCSPSFVYKKLAAFGLNVRKMYSTMTDEELDMKVSKLHADYPNSGQQMMKAYLEVDGAVVQRSRVRDSLRRVDPHSAAKRWSKTVKRRTYHVPTPNSLWHMDGHMKLVRWKLVTHGCIDGFSRCITYLKCGSDNYALTVLTLFVEATLEYGIPSRTRSDHGGENFFVALFMELVQGSNRASHITGESKHNQRIERLWRDVFFQVISYFYELFYHMEDDGQLNSDDPADLEALHQVYLPEINRRLTFFQQAWNRHSLRTAQHSTPNQLWLSGVLNNMNTNCSAVGNIFGNRDLAADLTQSLLHYGLSPDLLGSHDELQVAAHGGLSVTPPMVNISSERIRELVQQCTAPNLKERYLQLKEFFHMELNQI
ncbi:hypothetical protein BSL78_09042 [Apostichopus japonicus]|uniref:Integrase catalytic domain-containing protein n=1 Tax=Stichopus japonicus TaxID=307972 RepID=A0A2G8L1E0_STIJA|nr:hypothetical protein BSL78_09042 [Apostichopus japonicus]